MLSLYFLHLPSTPPHSILSPNPFPERFFVQIKYQHILFLLSIPPPPLSPPYTPPLIFMTSTTPLTYKTCCTNYTPTSILNVELHLPPLSIHYPLPGIGNIHSPISITTRLHYLLPDSTSLSSYY